MFLFDNAIFSAVSSLTDGSNGASMLSSSDCNYYSCDHSADYVSHGSDGVSNLTKDGTIYPEYKPLGAAVGEPSHGPTMLANPSGCSGYTCDNSADYIGHGSDGVSGLTNDGVIYPGYKPLWSANAEATHGPTMLADPAGCSGYACDNSADYIGSDGKLLTDGVIYPAQTKAPLPILSSSDCSYYSCDHSADYVGSNSDGVSNLTTDGKIYPSFQYGVWGAVSSHSQGVAPTMLADGSHIAPPNHSGAFYCVEPEANCSTTVVDPVLKPIVYPEVSQSLAVPAMATANTQSKEAKPSRPSPGHLMLMGHACIFGAIDATSKLAAGFLSTEKVEKESSWTQDFVSSSNAAAGAVTPVGSFILREHILKPSASQ